MKQLLLYLRPIRQKLIDFCFQLLFFVLEALRTTCHICISIPVETKQPHINSLYIIYNELVNYLTLNSFCRFLFISLSFIVSRLSNVFLPFPSANKILALLPLKYNFKGTNVSPWSVT